MGVAETLPELSEWTLSKSTPKSAKSCRSHEHLEVPLSVIQKY